jgi:hypothetical protein
MSKAHNGWLLILGVIVQMVGWIAIYPANPTNETSVQAAALRADETMAYVGLIMGFGGMLAMLFALTNVARSIQMAGGQGSSYAGIAAFLSSLAAAGALVCAGLEFSVIGASSDVGAVTLMGTSLAIGNGMILGIGSATLLLGMAILLTKKVYLVVGAFAILVGIVLWLGAFFGQDSPLAGLGFGGWAIASIGIGFHSIRSAD